MDKFTECLLMLLIVLICTILLGNLIEFQYDISIKNVTIIMLLIYLKRNSFKWIKTLKTY